MGLFVSYVTLISSKMVAWSACDKEFKSSSKWNLKLTSCWTDHFPSDLTDEQSPLKKHISMMLNFQVLLLQFFGENFKEYFNDYFPSFCRIIKKNVKQKWFI